MKRRCLFIATILGTLVLYSGCGKKTTTASQADRAEQEEGEGGEGVSFKEGLGLVLSPEILKALNLTTGDVEERSLASEFRLTAQVYASTPAILASVAVPAAQADSFAKSNFAGAKLVRIDRSAAAATRQTDLLLELDAGTPRRIGEFVSISVTSAPSRVVAVPHSAILDSAGGTFVYVKNAGAFVRTPVKLGIRSSNFVEVVDGLLDGDVIVIQPVEQLWLAELRLTKGGGHSH